MKKGAWITDEFDYPEEPGSFTQDEQYCLSAAKEIGTATEELINSIITPSSLTHRRKAQALLRLADTYGINAWKMHVKEPWILATQPIIVSKRFWLKILINSARIEGV